jgi:hypothetical protein
MLKFESDYVMYQAEHVRDKQMEEALGFTV